MTEALVLRHMSAQQLGDLAGAALIQGPSDSKCTGLCTDSRQLQAGDLFVALRGERFDGHRFLQAAVDAGAHGLVVEKGAPLPPSGGHFVIEVASGRHFLGQLASALIALRRQAGPLPIYAVTGSNGKTTTKEILAALLGAKHKGQVLKTLGNFNNEIGLPLTVAQLRFDHRAAVLEMGANHPGEIRGLCEIAPPDVALLTSIAPAHLEGFGSLAGVAAAKAEIFERPETQRVVFPESIEDLLPQLRQDPRARRVGTNDCAVKLLNFKQGNADLDIHYQSDARDLELRLPLLGPHNATNLGLCLAALAPLPTQEVLQHALDALQLPPGRLQVLNWGEVEIMQDAYNANPASMRAAMATLAARAAASKRYLVLGEMRELGTQSASLHEALGAELATQGAAALWAVGGRDAAALAAGAQGAGIQKVEHCGAEEDSIKAIIEALAAQLRPGDTLLLKGSRAIALERVAAGLSELPPPDP